MLARLLLVLLEGLPEQHHQVFHVIVLHLGGGGAWGRGQAEIGKRLLWREILAEAVTAQFVEVRVARHFKLLF